MVDAESLFDVALTPIGYGAVWRADLERLKHLMCVREMPMLF